MAICKLEWKRMAAVCGTPGLTETSELRVE
jgi:hypothetical protein